MSICKYLLIQVNTGSESCQPLTSQSKWTIFTLTKFEDVPEEVLTDPTMRTALGMDPIPGMNTPVDDDKQISMFDYMQNKNNSSASSSTSNASAPEVTVFNGAGGSMESIVA